jgi:hypothetical protein
MKYLVALLAVGCASHPIPERQLADARAAIESANVAGAANLAPVELHLARQKLELSQRWIDSRDYQPARWLAEQADIDAQLAVVKSRATSLRQGVRQ